MVPLRLHRMKGVHYKSSWQPGMRMMCSLSSDLVRVLAERPSALTGWICMHCKQSTRCTTGIGPVGSCWQKMEWKLLLYFGCKGLWFIWKHLIGEADPHYLKVQGAAAWCVIYLRYARKFVWHQRSCTSKTHQSSESKMSETFHLSLWATLQWLMAWWLSITAPHHLLFYICINLHTIWKITNDNILKNYSQYPSAIQMNNFILKGDSKRGSDVQEERDVCQHCFILTFCSEAVKKMKLLWIFDACWRPEWPL